MTAAEDPHRTCREAMEWRDREIASLRANTELLGQQIQRMNERVEQVRRLGQIYLDGNVPVESVMRLLEGRA